MNYVFHYFTHPSVLYLPRGNTISFLFHPKAGFKIHFLALPPSLFHVPLQSPSLHSPITAANLLPFKEFAVRSYLTHFLWKTSYGLLLAFQYRDHDQHHLHFTNSVIFLSLSFLFFFFGRILDKSVLMKEGLALIYNFAGKIHYVGENTVMGEQRADRSHGTCSSGTREI